MNHDGPCRYSWQDDRQEDHECMNWGGHKGFHKCCCGEWADE